MAAESKIIDNAIQFWQTIRDEQIVTVKFTKKTDGTTRIMKCTLDFNKIPKADHPNKNINLPKILKLMQTSKIIHVYDLDKKGWRSIPFDQVEYLKTPNNMYKIKST